MHAHEYLSLEDRAGIRLLRLNSPDGTNRLSRACVLALTDILRHLADKPPRALVIAGNEHFFSAGAELQEVRALDPVEARVFAHLGQSLMNLVDDFPAPVIAAISGYCMGGGLDLALACDARIAHPRAVFGHRGAALGLITGWGGTQRLPRLVGRARALQMFLTAEKLTGEAAWHIGLVQQVSADPIQTAMENLSACR